MDPRSLQQFYETHEGKATDKWSLYLATYERLFASYREKPIRLLEIGIQNGGSLEIWSEYFPQSRKIVGCDINPDCGRLDYSDPRIAVIVGDANDAGIREEIFSHADSYDIILDDGSHRSSDIVKSFLNYFPCLTDGGIFVAEDLHCSYWKEFEGGLFDPFSSISFFKRLVDIVNHESWGVPRTRSGLLKGIVEKYGGDVDDASLAEIHSIEFVNSICVVRKQPAAQNALGTRFVAGTVEGVVSGNLSLHGGVPLYFPDQTGNPWSSRGASPEEELSEVVEQLQESTETVSRLELLLAQRSAELAARDQLLVELDMEKSSMRDQFQEERGRLVQELRSMTSSSCWRITAPYRWLGERVKRLTRMGGL